MHCASKRRDASWQASVIGHTPLRPWLQERGSLTSRLKRQYADFSVQVLAQGWRKPHADEQVLLQLPAHQHAWVREVMLMGQGQPQVFAHSVIARQGLRGAWCDLRHLGRRPLGATLFANPRVQRSQLHYRKLPLSHPLYKAFCRHVPQQPSPVLWARRSLFCLQYHRLLVTEVFLASCAEHASRSSG